jgi:hypothetical protein
MRPRGLVPGITAFAADGRHLIYGTEYGTIHILRLRGR